MSANAISITPMVPANLATQARSIAARQGETTEAMPTVTSVESRVSRRKEALTYLFEWIREAAIGMVNDWPELFEVGCEHARFQHELRSHGLKSEQVNDPKIKEDLKDWENALADDLSFYNRCAQIYAEEMAPVGLLAVQARERAAKRIEEELNGKGSGIPDALRENDPQEWASDIDWS